MVGALAEEAMGNWMSIEALRELVEETHRNCPLEHWYDFHAWHRD